MASKCSTNISVIITINMFADETHFNTPESPTVVSCTKIGSESNFSIQKLAAINGIGGGYDTVPTCGTVILLKHLLFCTATYTECSMPSPKSATHLCSRASMDVFRCVLAVVL